MLASKVEFLNRILLVIYLVWINEARIINITIVIVIVIVNIIVILIQYRCLNKKY